MTSVSQTVFDFSYINEICELYMGPSPPSPLVADVESSFSGMLLFI
jgi:hypothetical protein